MDLRTLFYIKKHGGGGTPAVLDSIDIAANGIYTPEAGVDGFNKVTVEVQPDLEEINITENGTYTPTKDGFSSVEVNVAPIIEAITIDENGVYQIKAGTDGYGPITVDVAGGDVPSGEGVRF